MKCRTTAEQLETAAPFAPLKVHALLVLKAVLTMRLAMIMIFQPAFTRAIVPVGPSKVLCAKHVCQIGKLDAEATLMKRLQKIATASRNHV